MKLRVLESWHICRTLFPFLICDDTLSRLTLRSPPAPFQRRSLRNMSSAFLFFLVGAFVCVFSHESWASSLAAGQLRSYSTVHSIGVEWDIAGDTDHDAIGTVQYRVQGTSVWKQGFPLFRVDYTNPDGESFNMFAGSLLFLSPGTTYEVKVDIVDPDGGTGNQTLLVSTRAIPMLHANGRTLHVAPGTGSGDGTAGNPYKGIAAAQAVAQPGDIFLLHTGNYGGRMTFNRSGTAGNYIAWKAAGDGDVSFNGILVSASYIWLEGVMVNNQSNALTTSNAPVGVVVTRSTFTNNHYSIYLDGGGQNWYITDNIIVGDNVPSDGGLSGEGIELWKTSGHVVAYNRISRSADGISYPHTNVDIYGNDIFDTSDDGIEPDYGYANVRIWGNRIHNAVHNGISFQDMNGAPWYLIRNQIVGSEQMPFKFRETDRFLAAHNTLVSWGNVLGDSNDGQDMLMGISRNNLWVSVTSGTIWNFQSAVKTWRTDLDYDGFDWGNTSTPFVYGGQSFPNLSTLTASSGLEEHGVRITKASCFETFNVPSPPPASVPVQAMTLRSGCNAIDIGAVLPNINEDYMGSAPDLGAYEFGRPLPQYGPRPLDAQPPAAPQNLRFVSP